MTVRQALDEKRQQFAGQIGSLVLCKRELFYYLKDGRSIGDGPEDSVYPVDHKLAAKEARFFGVQWHEA